MRRKRILERFDEFVKNKISNEETNIPDEELEDEVDNIDVKKSDEKIKEKELSDEEMNDENIVDLVEEIKQYLKKIDERNGK